MCKKDTHRSRNRSRSSTECGEANQYFANLYKRREEKRPSATPVSNAAEVPAYISIHHTDLSLYSVALLTSGKYQQDIRKQHFLLFFLSKHEPDKKESGK